MDLRQEVAQVASRLGFSPKIDLGNGEAPAVGDKIRSGRMPKGEGKKASRRRSQKAPPKGANGKRQKPRKGETKTDVYDKKALLEVLSGPPEKPEADLKKLRKAKSVLPKSMSPVWHVALEELAELSEKKARRFSAAQIEEKRRAAAKMCQNEKDAFEYRLHSSKKQGKWLLQVRAQGTHVDRIAALSLLIRDSVVANISELEFLMRLAEKQKGSRDVVIQALKALEELFRCFLLPDRKLLFFEERPLHLLSEHPEWRQYLVLWFVEDDLKRKFARLVACLETACLAPLEHLRSEAVTLVSDLLYNKPEQESQLLSILINKFGDSSKKLGSKVAFLISKLITKHPRMKRVILREADKFVYLSGTSMRAIHRVLQTFNSIEFEHSDVDRDTAMAYIDMCFTLFQQVVDGAIGSVADLERKTDALNVASAKKTRKRKLLQKKKPRSMETDAGLLNALIAGIRRTMPFADASEMGGLLDKHIQALFRMIHLAPFGVSVQIIALLMQILSIKGNYVDRLYRAIYEKLLDPQLATSKKIPLFISTIFKVIKDDPNLSRAVAFVKRLLQVASNAEPNLYCAFLLVTSELLKFKPGLKSGILQPEERPQLEPITSTQGADRPLSDKGADPDFYRIDHREPVFCGAEHTCLWELCLSLHHYHPVAFSMGTSLLSGGTAISHGDPLQDLTLFAFLEKFVNKKDSKAKRAWDDRTPTTPGSSLASRYEGSCTFAGLASQDVHVEDVFFHKYFNLHGVRKAREARQTAKKAKRATKDGAVQQQRDFLREDDDLESLESLELEEDAVVGEDVDAMFAAMGQEKEKPADEFFDYSDLMQNIEDELDDADNEAEGWDEADSSIASQASADLELPTHEFPVLSSYSSDMETEAPWARKRSKTSRSNLGSDFAPAEEYAALLDSDCSNE